MFADFHFIRPEWLLMLIPLAIAIWLFGQTQRKGGYWHHFCDEALIPFVVSGHQYRGGRDYSRILLSVIGLLTVIAIAGPAWERKQMPLFRDTSALVVLFDLSKSMDAQDLRPSRLVRARLKLHDLLKQRKSGQTALIVYAAQPYVVTPLTDDTATIAAMLGTLSTEMMPTQGSRPDLAIEKGVSLLNQAGMSHGQILLISDGIHRSDVGMINHEISKLKQQGHLLSVIAVGTTDGAPIPMADGGFLKDNQGSIVVAKLDEDLLKQIASSGGGVYSPMQIDNSDIKALQQIDAFLQDGSQDDESMQQGEQWQDMGPWLLIFIVPLTVLMFRQGFLLITIVLLIPLPQKAEAFEWSQLWKNSDQRGQELMQQEDYEGAANTFKDERWQAMAQFRNKNYQKALELLEPLSGIDDEYNRGNSYAMMGDYQNAIKSYERVLKLNPKHEDAAYNLEQLKSLMEQQKSDSTQAQDQDSQEQNTQQGQTDQGEQGQQSESSQMNQSEAQQQQGSEAQQQEGSSSSETQQMSESDQQGEQEDNQTAFKNQDEDSDHSDQEQNVVQKGDNNDQEQPDSSNTFNEEQPETESQQAMQQWLRRIPDDPGGLLKRKFKYQYQRQYQNSREESQAW